MGPNEQYTNVHGQILLINPLPDLSHSYSILLQEENQREFRPTSIVSEHSVMNVKFHSSNSSNKAKVTKKASDTSVYCDHNNMARHSRGIDKQPDISDSPLILPESTFTTPPALTHSQYQELMQLLQANVRPQASHAPWIHEFNNQTAGSCFEEGERDW
ncbi:hypothetical protein AgCh_001813 [Apium graveolens]